MAALLLFIVTLAFGLLVGALVVFLLIEKGLNRNGLTLKAETVDGEDRLNVEYKEARV